MNTVETRKHEEKTTAQLWADLDSMGVNVAALRAIPLTDRALIELVAGIDYMVKRYESRHPGAGVSLGSSKELRTN